MSFPPPCATARSLHAPTPAPAAAPADTTASLAEKGDAKALQDLALQFEQQKNYGEAIKWYTRAAEQGSSISQSNLAQMYEKGIGVAQDFAQAADALTIIVWIPPQQNGASHP